MFRKFGGRYQILVVNLNHFTLGLHLGESTNMCPMGGALPVIYLPVTILWQHKWTWQRVCILQSAIPVLDFTQIKVRWGSVVTG